MRRHLTEEEQKFLVAWRGLEALENLLRTDPKFCEEYERLVEEYGARHGKATDIKRK